MAAIPVIASKAVWLISGKRQRKTSRKKVKTIRASGAFVVGLTLCKYYEYGKALSLAIAKPILVVTVILLNPAQKTLTSKSKVIVTDPNLL